ncbi:MAG: hypothetical protein M1153_01240 [Patescibacteria group bacterium]|nr:hypothetical protein [Patescibacteria group bacterium]
MENLLIIGAGELGQALGSVARANIKYFDRDPEKTGETTANLAALGGWASLVFVCVPSAAVPEITAGLKGCLQEGCVIVSFAKGLLEDEKTPTEFLFSVFPNNPVGAVSGPMLAGEIKSGLPSFGLAAFSRPGAAEKLLAVFRDTNLKIEITGDLRGLSVIGFLKNIYVLAIGMADASGWGMNAQGRLISVSLAEISRILPLLGATSELAYSPAGVGDLIATAFSGESLNREAGKELIKEGKIVKSEGMRSLPALQELLGDKSGGFPLFSAIKNSVDSKGKNALRALSDVLKLVND